jgi:hypothetical protein
MKSDSDMKVEERAFELAELFCIQRV